MIDIIPAIDVIDGRCVRLTQGDYSRSKIYSGVPVDVAKGFEDCGVKMLHLVDLDGARSKRPVNLGVLEEIASSTSLKVEFGGGIKDEGSVSSVFDAGAFRIVCGSIACSAPNVFAGWLHRYGGDRLVLGADVRDGFVAVNGWMEQSSVSVGSRVGRLLQEGLKTAVVTDISRDGMLSGPSLPLYRELSEAFPALEIVASGGVGCVDDILALDRAGIPAVIVGKAIYEGRISPEELRNL